MNDIDLRIFIPAAMAVFMGSLTRRAKELNAMETISQRTLIKMFGIELMLMPSFSSCAGFFVFYYQLAWPWTLPIGVAMGIGGFATGTLIFELFANAVRFFAERTTKGGA